MSPSPLTGCDPTTSLQIGRVVHGRYRVTERVGAGRWGTVYRATETVLGQTVALKCYRPELCEDPAFVEGLTRQVALVARLVSRQETLVGIHECVRTDCGQLVLVMDDVSGRSVREMLVEGGALPMDTALRIAAQVARALDALHTEHLVHGDLRPEHVLVTSTPSEGGVALKGFEAMWGLEETSVAGRLLSDGVIKPLLGYRAPEQRRGEPPTARTDVYGIGVLLYEMLTGATPFTTEQADGSQETPVPPCALRSEIPRALQAEILRALHRNPEHRQGQIRELVETCRFQALYIAWEAAQTEAAGLRGWLDPIVARISNVSLGALLLVAAASVALAVGVVLLFAPPSQEAAPALSPAAANASSPAPPPSPAVASSPPRPIRPAAARPAQTRSSHARQPARRRAIPPSPPEAARPPARPPGSADAEPTDGTEIMDWLFRR